MQWHYADEGRQIGPVSEEEFQSKIRSGHITATTLVWQPGMSNWVEYGSLQELNGENAACSQCGRLFSKEDMIHYGDSWVCATCKPAFVQKIKEGVALPGAMDYAGFWLRFGAKVIDYIILTIVQMVLSFGTVFLMQAASEIAAVIILNVLQIVIFAAYSTFFVGKYGATVGKLACQIKIVVDDGGRVSYLRALGRHFAEMISAMILFIGYIMAGFDDEKRTLHDRICSTRVIRK